jgi:hypothetical protein
VLVRRMPLLTSVSAVQEYEEELDEEAAQYTQPAEL